MTDAYAISRAHVVRVWNDYLQEVDEYTGIVTETEKIIRVKFDADIGNTHDQPELCDYLKREEAEGYSFVGNVNDHQGFLYAVATKLDSNSADFVGVYTGTIGSSAKIEDIFHVILPTTLAKLALVPRGGGTIYISDSGLASTASPMLPTGGIETPMRYSIAITKQLMASGVDCDLWVYEWRTS
jgi:hypothetical protein